MKSSKN